MVARRRPRRAGGFLLRPAVQVRDLPVCSRSAVAAAGAVHPPRTLDVTSHACRIFSAGSCTSGTCGTSSSGATPSPARHARKSDATYRQQPPAWVMQKRLIDALLLALLQVYREDPAILAWELINEPRCRGCAGALRSWIRDMAAFVKRIDPVHLLSVGCAAGKHHPPSGLSLLTSHGGAAGAASHHHHQASVVPAPPPLFPGRRDSTRPPPAALTPRGPIRPCGRGPLGKTSSRITGTRQLTSQLCTSGAQQKGYSCPRSCLMQSFTFFYKSMTRACLCCRPENWAILSSTGVAPIPYAQQWLNAHIEDSHRILGKPLLVEEFGRSEQVDATGNGRDQFYEAVHRTVERARAEGARSACMLCAPYVIGCEKGSCPGVCRPMHSVEGR